MGNSLYRERVLNDGAKTPDKKKIVTIAAFTAKGDLPQLKRTLNKVGC